MWLRTEAKELITPVLFGGVLTKVLLAGSAATLCALFAPQLSQILLRSSEYTFLFQLLSLDIFFACIYTTMNSLLLGLNKITEMATLNLVLAITRQTFVLLFLFSGHKLAGYVGGWILGDLSYVFLAGVILLKGKHFRVHSVGQVVPHLRRLIKFSLPLLVTNIIIFLYGWFDRAILLAYVPLTEVAIYNVAYTAFGVLYVIPTALSTTLFPYFSEQHGRDIDDQIAAGVSASTRYIALFYTPLALGLMVMANPVLALFAGQRYVSGDMVLATLSLLGGVAGVGAVFGILLLVYNITLVFLVINVVSIGFGVVLSHLLLPSLGVEGMAIVKGSVLIVSVILSIVALRNKGIVQFEKEAMWKGLSAALLMSIIVWLIFRMYSSPYLLPAYILIGGVVYAFALRLLKAIEKYDIQIIRSLMGKRAAPLINILEKILI